MDRGDAGSATVEFLGMTLILMVPLVYLIVTLGNVQAGAFAAEAAASSAARAAAVSGVQALEAGMSPADARAAAQRRAQAVLQVTLDDYSIDAATQSTLTLLCEPEPCFAPGSIVVARVGVTVGLPGIPKVGSAQPIVATLTSQAASPVDGFANGAAS